MTKLILNGKVNLNRTASKFSILINENKKIFAKYFGVDLFPGSLNIIVDNPPDLQENLDKGIPTPDFTIPRDELVGMPAYIGAGQTWSCKLKCGKFKKDINCWVFRRIGSRVPRGVIEIVSDLELVKPNGLCNGDDISIEFNQWI
ncbi:MAG: DUF120 domain-containing protein [Candidatus Marinimicrobia bacterium]|nr:DUF120 domain-containing protein [Candidatus Neomarinimicrobiota bacterium]